MKPSRAAAWWLAICCCLMLCVIAAYAALLPRARWQGDEYLVFALLRDGGWGFYRYWYLAWSPRLVSNLFYGAYGIVVLAVHRPLAGTCMAVLWAALAGACVLPALRTNTNRLTRVLAGLALFVLFLVGHSVTEVFYWPSGGLSYIPTLAGTVWLFWLMRDGLGTQIPRHAAAAAALFVLGGSSELGIFIALSIAACCLCARLRWSWRYSVWLLPGAAVAIADLALVLHARVGTIELGGGDPALLHHAGASVLRAIPAFASNLARPDTAGGAAISAPFSLIARLLILCGAHWTFGKSRETGSLLPAFGAALLLAAFASVASAYFQFGRLCCARHDTLRACLITLAAVALGAAWPRYRPNAAAACWAAAVLVLFLPAAPSVLADYRSMDKAISARARSWASAKAPGDTMVFITDPPGRVIAGNAFAPGFASVSPDTVWWRAGILRFFGKKSLVIEPPD